MRGAPGVVFAVGPLLAAAAGAGACSGESDASSGGAASAGPSSSAASVATGSTGGSGSGGGGADGGGSGGAAGGGGCAPQAVTPTTPPWKDPHPLHANQCSAADAAAIVSCFIDAQNCATPVAASCHACALSGPSSPSSGPLLLDAQNQPAGLNVAGCVAALAGDPSDAGCGPKLEAKEACVAEACAACPDAQACEAAAVLGVCATQAAEAKCADPYLAECVQGATELEIAFHLVEVFCGP